MPTFDFQNLIQRRYDLQAQYSSVTIEDRAEHFYIILTGEVGVFVPRQQHHINGEMDAVKRMCERLDKKDLWHEEISEYLESPYCREEKSKKEFLSRIYSVREGIKVVFHDFYVNEILGGVAERVRNQSDLFNSVRFADRRKAS